ncbi:MAG TPA: MoaD/ThiS family protein [Flavitalea sp.]|nr:MoaD/ThiS family protein [Flavitalea sp.]
MRIQVFAALKDFFDNEFEADGSIKTLVELRRSLILSKPEAENILNNCRFAVHEEFVDMNYKLKANDTIAIIPPSSGG